MSNHLPDQQPSACPPTAPPMATIASGPMAQNTWPMAIGIIALIFGVISLLGALSGLLSPFMLGAMEALPGAAATIDPMTAWLKWTIPLAAVGLMLAILLVVASIGLLKRRRYSRVRLLTYAVLVIPHALASVLIGYLVQQDAMTVAASMQNMPVSTPTFQSMVGGFTICFGLTWNLALPVFLLIWLNRAKIKQEVAGWSTIIPQAQPV